MLYTKRISIHIYMCSARFRFAFVIICFSLRLYGFICAGTEVACACSAMSPAIIDTPGIKPLLLMRCRAARWSLDVEGASDQGAPQLAA